MSQLSRGIFAAVAISLTCGAVQLAAGRDLIRGPQNSVTVPESATNISISISNISINRAAKADRAARLAGQAVPTQTISLRLDALADTSILVRVPAAKEGGNKEARNGSSAPPSSAPAVTKSGSRKMAVACEPVVSVLTDVAKLLQPGRCIT
ncbi:MAG: hypothetical protein QOI87_1712 [Bradyrhizobium sp.]|jgi:hypothetical protein|nr:hypothetical protein [Bradyrhizobium sp.]